jgi:hypothetical protein
MSVLRSEISSRRSLHARMREVTLGELSVVFGVTFVVCLLCFVVLFLLGMHFFTATASEVPWFYPLEMLVMAIWVLSALGWTTIRVVVLLRRLIGRRGLR